MATHGTLPSAAVDVALVNFSGAPFFYHDIEYALVDAGLRCHVVHADKKFPQELPNAKVIMQLGLGAMPDVGLRLLVHVRNLAPAVPILVCSSHREATMAEVVEALAGAMFIQRSDRLFLDKLVPFLRRLIAENT